MIGPLQHHAPLPPASKSQNCCNTYPIRDFQRDLLNTHHTCRYMLGIAGIPSLIMLVGMLFMPESPRWLVFHKKGEKARRVLLRSRTASKVDEEMEAIEKDYVVHRQNKMGEGNWSHVGHMQVTCRSHASCMQCMYICIYDQSSFAMSTFPNCEYHILSFSDLLYLQSI